MEKANVKKNEKAVSRGTRGRVMEAIVEYIYLLKPRKVQVLSNAWSDKTEPSDLTRGIPKHLCFIYLFIAILSR